MSKSDLEQEKLLLERAVARKEELKLISKALHKRHEQLKQEIERRKHMITALAEKYLSESQAQIESEFLDTVEIDDRDLQFPKK